VSSRIKVILAGRILCRLEMLIGAFLELLEMLEELSGGILLVARVGRLTAFKEETGTLSLLHHKDHFGQAAAADFHLVIGTLRIAMGSLQGLGPIDQVQAMADMAGGELVAKEGLDCCLSLHSLENVHNGIGRVLQFFHCPQEGEGEAGMATSSCL
jgi:hypothetical protein